LAFVMSSFRDTQGRNGTVATVAGTDRPDEIPRRKMPSRPVFSRSRSTISMIGCGSGAEYVLTDVVSAELLGEGDRMSRIFLHGAVPAIVVATVALCDPRIAVAQGGDQGPLLLVPRSSIDAHSHDDRPARGYRYDAPSTDPWRLYSDRDFRGSSSRDLYGGSGYRGDSYGGGDFGWNPSRPDHEAVGDHFHGPVRFADPRMQQTNDWYRNLLGRSMSAREMETWQRHFDKGHPSGDDAMLLETFGTILGSDEYYRKVGGRFEDWIRSVTRVSGTSVSRDEVAHFVEDYRRSPDPRNFRIGFTRHLLADHAPQPVVVPEPYHHGGRYGHGGRRPEADRGPWYVQQPQHDHDHDHGHSHTTGYRPQGDGTGQTLQTWHTRYIGHKASGQEVRELLHKHQQGGVSLDELRAGLIASPEWYARTGSRPERWVEATLKSLDESTGRRNLERWNERHRNNNNDRYRTALEMLK
jgi:hypothetical protein